MRKSIRLKKRADVPAYLHIVLPMIGVLAALIFCAALILVMGGNPLDAYKRLLQGAFGSGQKIATTLIKAIPLMLCGLCVAVAFKMRLMTIGAEGQMTIGCLAVSGIALFVPIEGPLKIVVMLIVGFLAGGLWALISVLPKVYLGVSEVIVTLLMNYVGILFSEYFIYGPWRDPNGDNMPFSAPFEANAKLPNLFGSGVHAGILVALVAAVLLYFVLKRTVWGYQLKVIGESKNAARYAGMNIRRNILITMLISGGLAGLAGVCEVAGTVGILKTGISNDAGYTAIIIAYLAKFNPLVVVLVSVLFGGLQAGSYSMQLVGLPVQIVPLLQGAILLFVLAAEYLTEYKIVFVQKEGKEKKPHVS